MEDYFKPNIHSPSEMDECKAYWKWAQNYPVLRNYLYKIVNEGRRSPISGKNLKLIGLRKGIPDYHLPVANEKYYGFWLEMKTQDQSNYRISVYQSEWIDKLRAVNQYATFGYGWEDAAKKTLAYIKNKI